jgi:16S rRNA U516 pseudouridylate synthase RsuA-like enzyme
MFAALGYRVVSLERVRIGALTLYGSLNPGGIRTLSAEEAALVFAKKE